MSQEGRMVSSLLHPLMLSKLSFIMRYTVALSVPAVDGVTVFKDCCHAVHSIMSFCVQ
jgi:hypothetical protein